MDVDRVKWQWELFAASHRLLISLHCAILAIVSIHQFRARLPFARRSGGFLETSSSAPATDYKERRAPDIQGDREMNHADDGCRIKYILRERNSVVVGLFICKTSFDRSRSDNNDKICISFNQPLLRMRTLASSFNTLDNIDDIVLWTSSKNIAIFLASTRVILKVGIIARKNYFRMANAAVSVAPLGINLKNGATPARLTEQG